MGVPAACSCRSTEARDDPAHGKIFCIMMEFADQGDLATLLSERWEAAAANKVAWLPEEDVMSWFVQLAKGLEHSWR